MYHDDPSQTFPPMGRYPTILDRLMKMDYDRGLAGYAIGWGQQFYAEYIYDHPGTSAQEMVECIRVDKATLTKTIKKLSDIGYVRIVSDPQDRRVKRLFLTQEGIPAVQRVKEIHGAFFQTLCAGIPPQDIQAAQRTLARMVENLTPVVRHRMEDPHAAQ